MSEKTLGQIAFDAYNANRGGKTHDGKDTPPWEALTDGVREGWQAAAQASRDDMQAQMYVEPGMLVDMMRKAIDHHSPDDAAKQAAHGRLEQIIGYAGIKLTPAS